MVMTRREFQTGVASAVMAGIIPDAKAQEDDRKAQYAICKQLGHQGEPLAAQNAVFSYPPLAPRRTCKWCGTTYWTETIQREEGVPK